MVCLHFYRGEGYSPDYVEHLWKVVRRAEEGEKVEVISGADDICKACPYLKGERCGHKDEADEEIQKLDKLALDFLAVNTGDHVSWSDLRKKVLSAPKSWFDSFCADCDWFDLCNRIREQ
ncbi:MAG: DUF1284 domain-containing protein [Syntrophaceticus schinkii]|nr:DUF1284 domain-containing protein [Syntrophaceticus schinkii]